jgi:hypothetical protein
MKRSHLSLATLAVAQFLVLFFIFGCGGGGGGGNTPIIIAPTGKQAFRTSALSSYKGTAAGTAYPLEAIMLAAPTGSHLPIARQQPQQSNTPVYNAALNLYQVTTKTNKGYTINYYLDSAAIQSAGKVVIPVPNGSNAYKSYPVDIPLTINITGGNLPCLGTLDLKFTGASGANTLNGRIQLTQDDIPIQINLTLDNALNVSGSIAIQADGLFVKGTSVSGPLAGDITCKAVVDPEGWKGSATLNLLKGTIGLSLDTSSTKKSTSTADSSGGLTIKYGDGTSDTVTSPLTTSITSSPSSGNT